MRKLIVILLLGISSLAFSQEQEVDFLIDEQALKLNEKFKITAIIKGRGSDQIIDFPMIAGLKKEARLASHANVVQNGKKVLQHTVVQNYIAETAGLFNLENAKIVVNGKIYILPDTRIIFENSEMPDSETFLSQTEKNTALLFLFVSKKEIYVGESFRIYLAFYVSEDNTERWEFPKNLSAKINKLAEDLKPKNCIESQVIITDIVEETAQVNNKNYKLYKLVEAVYYPLMASDITIPSVNLVLSRALTTDSTQFENVPFSSKPFTLHVMPLPDHPLAEKVAVGHFTLVEPKPLLRKVQTGKIINVSIELRGLGNAQTLTFEKPDNNAHFDFYPSSGGIKQKNGSEQGQRIFTFKVFPKEAGTYNLSDYFQWIYFDTQKGNYDTLRPLQRLSVSGSKIITYAGEASDIYFQIEEKSIAHKEINYRRAVKSLANILLFLMLVGMLFIFDFKRR